MSVKCAKGHDHGSINEVRSCYGVASRAISSAYDHADVSAAEAPTVFQELALGLVDYVPDTVAGDITNEFDPFEDARWDLELQRREQEEADRVAQFKTARDLASIAPQPVAREIPIGTYTFTKQQGQGRRTIQIAPAAWADGAIAASFLSGPDNNLNYTGFAFVKPGGKFNLWKKFQGSTALAADLDFLLNKAIVADAHEAFLEDAEAYALRSSKCLRCNRKLTVPASLHRGLGPVCAGIEGIA